MRNIKSIIIVFLILCGVLAMCILIPYTFINKQKNLTLDVDTNTTLNEKQSTNQKLKEEFQNNTINSNIQTLIENQKIITNKKDEDEKMKILDEKYNNAFDLYVNGNYYDTISLCSEIIDENGEYYKAYSLRGIAQCYTMYPGAFDAGMADVNTALSLKGDYAFGMYNKALIYDVFGHYDEAITWYNKNLELEKYVWSYYNLAVIYSKQNNVQEAIKNLKYALELKPEIRDVIITDQNEKFYNVINDVEFQNLLR